MKSYSDIYGLIKKSIAEELGGGISGTSVSPGPQVFSAEQRALQSLSEASVDRIIRGLEVLASDPPSMSITIKAGLGYVGGTKVEMAENETIIIPTGEAIWYILVDAGARLSKYPSNSSLIAAKIILESDSLRIVQEKALTEGPDGYIIDGRTVYSSQKYDPSDPAFRDAIASAMPDIFAENIFGTLRLSENLTVENARGSMKASSDGMRFFDTEGRVLAEYLSTRARVAGWNIEPGKLYSQNIMIDSANESIGTANFVSGALGQGWRITPQEAEFQNARIRGIFSTAVFKKDTISASNAMNIWSNSSVLKIDLGPLDTDTTITVEDAVFTNGDRVRLKDGFNDEWMVVTSSASSNGNYWNYTVTRDLAGSYTSTQNPQWKIGTAIVSLGNWNGSVGTGFVMLDAASQDSPFLDILIRTGANPTQYATKARLGRLDGITDSAFGGTLSGYGLYADNVYLKGKIVIAAGSSGIGAFDDAGNLATLDSIAYPDITGSKPPINADNTTTIIDGGIITTGYINLSTGGNIRSGQTAYNTGTGFWIGNAAGTPKLSLGNSAGNYLIWDGSNLTINGSAAIKGGIAIGPTPSGSGLYLGSDRLGYYNSSKGWTAVIESGGTFYFGNENPSTPDKYIRWDGTNLDIRGRLTADDIIAGTLTGRTIQTQASGERIELSAGTKEARWYSDATTVIASIGVDSILGAASTFARASFLHSVTNTSYAGSVAAISGEAIHNTGSSADWWAGVAGKATSNYLAYGIRGEGVGTNSYGGYFTGAKADISLSGTEYKSDTIKENSVYRKIAYGILGLVTFRITNGVCTVIGTGFSASRTAAGIYTVTFTTAFSLTPVIVATGFLAAGTGTIVTKSAESASAFTVNVRSDAGTLQDSSFSFIASVI